MPLPQDRTPAAHGKLDAKLDAKQEQARARETARDALYEHRRRLHACQRAVLQAQAALLEERKWQHALDVSSYATEAQRETTRIWVACAQTDVDVAQDALAKQAAAVQDLELRLEALRHGSSPAHRV